MLGYLEISNYLKLFHDAVANNSSFVMVVDKMIIREILNLS